MGHHIELTFIMNIWNMFHIMGQRICYRAYLYPFQIKQPFIGQKLMHGIDKSGAKG